MLGPNDYDPVTLDHGERVRAYWNVTKSCWSVLTRAPKGWRVKGYTRGVFYLDDVDFVVQPGGRERVLARGTKNVHAYAVGTYTEDLYLQGTVLTVTYNPYKEDTFVTVDTDGGRWPMPGGLAKRVRFASYDDNNRVGPSVLAVWEKT